MSTLPLVSLIIPCRNEAGFIAACLESVLASDYPRERLEVLVVDGRSEDGTRAVVQEYAARYSHIRMLDNPRRSTPAGLNIGLRAARGEIILRRDAHGAIAPDYILRCVRALAEHDADCVGGVLKTRVRDSGWFASAIQLTLSHPLGVGNSRFRTGASRPLWVDALPYGCFRRQMLERVGGYNELLERSQDMDLWSRVRAAGGRLLLDPAIRSTYFARGRLGQTWRYNFGNGFWVTWPMRLAGARFSARHFAPLLFVGGLLSGTLAGVLWRPAWWLVGAVLGLYLAVTLAVSLQRAWRTRDWRLPGTGPAAFAVLHFSYGLGSLWGLLKPLPRHHVRRAPRALRPEAGMEADG